MYQKLHIFEEETNLFWGLIILICASAGTFILSDSFISEWSLLNADQLSALALFLISFLGIYKLSEPLYHFIFFFENDILIIKIKKGELDVDSFSIPVRDIEALKFSPHYPCSSNEALFDFSMNYHLMWRKKNEPDYRKLLDLESANFTLKVNDIADIMRFILQQNPNVSIPKAQADYFNL
ncbi:MAG TPA: hypothetical protein VF181_01490 [Balneolaceae bacterium]